MAGATQANAYAGIGDIHIDHLAPHGEPLVGVGGDALGLGVEPGTRVEADVLPAPGTTRDRRTFAMADLPNIYLKLTPRIMGDVTKGQASADTFFTKVAAVFGANRMAWGSNFPTSPGTLSDILATARDRLACLSDEDQNWVFAKTAQTLYPALKD